MSLGKPEAWGELLLDGMPGVGLLDDLQLECGLGLPPGLDDLGLDLSDGAFVGDAAASARSHPTSSDLLESLQLDAAAFGKPSSGTPSGSGSDSPVVLPLVHGAAAPSPSPLRSCVGLGHNRASPATSESEAPEGDAGGRGGGGGAASGQPGSRQQMSEEEKRLARMQRNRENAQLSRQRKKQQLSELDARCTLLTRHNAQLTGAVQRLTAENAALRQQLALVCQQAGRNAAAATAAAAAAAKPAAAAAKSAAAPAPKPAAAAAVAAVPRPAGAVPVAANAGAALAAPAAKGAATPATPAAAGVAAAPQAVTLTATPSATSAAAAAVAARGLLPFPLMPFTGLLPRAFPGQQQQQQQQQIKRPAPTAAPAAQQQPAPAAPAVKPAAAPAARAPKRARTAAGASTAFLALFSLFMFAGPFSPAPLTTTTAPGTALAGPGALAGAQRTLQALPDGTAAAAAAAATAGKYLVLAGDSGLHRPGRGLQALPAAASDGLLSRQHPTAAFDGSSAGGGGATLGASHMQRLLNSTLQALLLEPGNAQLEAAALQRLQELGPVALLLDADAPGAPRGANPLAASVAFPQLADQLFGGAGLEVPQVCQKMLEFDASSVPHAARSRRSLERYVLGATGFRGRSLASGKAGVGAALPPAQGGGPAGGGHAAHGGGTLRIEEEPAGFEDAEGELDGSSGSGLGGGKGGFGGGVRGGGSPGLLSAPGAADGPLLVSVLLPANASGGGNGSAPGDAKLAAIDKVFVVLLHPAERYVTYSCALPRAVVL